MTLRKKLVFLMIGMIFFPFLASGLTMFLVFLITGSESGAPEFMSYLRWLYEDFTPAVQKGGLPPMPKESFPLVFLSPDNTVLLSTDGAFPVGSRISPEAVFDAFRFSTGGNDQWQIIMQRVRRNNQEAGTLVVAGNIDFSLELVAAREWIFIFYIVLAIVLAAAIGGAGIIRNMRRSIAGLEEAAKKIAAGNYDFALVPRGRDEFTSLTESFETMRKTIQENSAQRSRFLMAVSHDLKTPLTSIRGYTEAIEDGMATDEETRARYLGIIRAKTGVLEERIFELIDFVRMQTGDWRMRHTMFGLKKFLVEISGLFAQDLRVEKKTFSARLDIPDSVEVLGDKALLMRVFENLFGNALRYSEENSFIELSAQSVSGGADIRLFNSGKGIAPEELELVFEPFYRGSSSRRERGFGLGLSSARSILENHGWSIRAESVPQSGVSFIIHIPLDAERDRPGNKDGVS
ncbi:MAG: HAMP domain-containing histidine kinase [Spirochaetales bacterium]|jgi:signal transduction histidine kinase|nr:HAMP domain-containing histidine kinase [Spirochaetales bacterium]